MAFRLKKAVSFAQGAWNIYILQPSWFHSKKLWPDASSFLVETLRDGPGFRYSADNIPTRWIVTPFRVAVETISENENTGPILANLLKVLPETPINGVANQFFFHGKIGELDPVSHPPVVFSGNATILGYGSSVTILASGTRYIMELTTFTTNKSVDLTITAIPEIPDSRELDKFISHLNSFESHHQTAECLALEYWGSTFNAIT